MGRTYRRDGDGRRGEESIFSMSEKTIRETHERLKAVKHPTLSVTIVNEVKSQAHKDRGELLDIITEHKKVNRDLLKLVNDTSDQLDEANAFIQEEVANGEDKLSQG